MAKTKDDLQLEANANSGDSQAITNEKEKRQMKYLDPKADLTFKKIFGKHPDLLMSLLKLKKRMAVLWLRFLTEINSNTDQVPEELTENPEINKALEELKITAFSEEELRAYDKFWDSVRVEKTLLHDNYEKGQNDEKNTIAKNLLNMGLPIMQIMQATGLTQEQIDSLKKLKLTGKKAKFAKART